ncbi:MAG: hypothetical protein N2255_05785, partial [Kiritimatiellae bacterium]|nr:hypothetical protein [Kiritimatiellia bacterium]
MPVVLLMNGSAINNGPVDAVGTSRTDLGLCPPVGRRVWIVLAVMLLIYSIFLSRFYAPAIMAPDANGYFAQGTLLARTGRTWFTLDSPVQYVGVHWMRTPDGRYFSRYPPGLPVVIAVVTLLFGPEASVAINPVLALVGAVGMFFFSRRILGSAWWGLAAVALLMINPLYARHALVC